MGVVSQIEDLDNSSIGRPRMTGASVVGEREIGVIGFCHADEQCSSLRKRFLCFAFKYHLNRRFVRNTLPLR